MFRRAREGLLHARGEQTLYAEKKDRDSGQFPVTIIQDKDARNSEVLCFWLQDQDECIYPLKVGVNTVGRSDDNDVVVADNYVSRRHCAILVHATSGCELHDIASKNGTFINGARLSCPTHLNPGDEIRMCGQHFIFHSRDESDAMGHHTQTLSPPPE
jgi:hypothetical protein